MTRARLITLLAATAALALGPVLFQNGKLQAQVPSPVDALLIGQPAPSWKLLDLDGREVSSSQFAGKVVVVDFWATWCTPCIKEIPGYIELQKKYGSDLAIIGISVDRKDASEVKKFTEKQGMNYTVVMADENVVSAFGGVEGIPTTFIISREGKFVHKKVGSMAHEDYENLLKGFLK
ncbi:TlpA family protein disulfide reductase [Oleiharenicola lentus]|uniref:TlpA family protein disulfide reductase n=1 Tax=Oleiharenicola lentus TaxID=2508720 RepID=UPI003F676B83